jgi:hypothetical protein
MTALHPVMDSFALTARFPERSGEDAQVNHPRRKSAMKFFTPDFSRRNTYRLALAPEVRLNVKLLLLFEWCTATLQFAGATLRDDYLRCAFAANVNFA